jgi:hypothetical protein
LVFHVAIDRGKKFEELQGMKSQVRKTENNPKTHIYLLDSRLMREMDKLKIKLDGFHLENDHAYEWVCRIQWDRNYFLDKGISGKD